MLDILASVLELLQVIPNDFNPLLWSLSVARIVSLVSPDLEIGTTIVGERLLMISGKRITSDAGRANEGILCRQFHR
ncbi:MAG: hypothetical protein DDT23_00916 [candidate division WS2 bacterium]|nr:hypothetical protein [Candidatus Lithacetigena glycinireducens]